MSISDRNEKSIIVTKSNLIVCVMLLFSSMAARGGSLAWEPPGPYPSHGICQPVSFDQSDAIALDKAGDIYIGNEHGSDAIQEVGIDGTIRTILDRQTAPIKSGHYFGLSLTTDPRGVIYLSVRERGTVERLDPNGKVTVVAGVPNDRRLLDGDAAHARLKSPHAISAGLNDLYVVDDRTIRRIELDGSIVTLAGSSNPKNQHKCEDGCPYTVDGKGSRAVFMSPNGISVGPDGDIYVADGYDGDVEGQVASIGVIRRVTPQGRVTTVAGSLNFSNGDFDGTGTQAVFDYVFGIAVDSLGDFYITEPFMASIRTLDSKRHVTTVIHERNPSYRSTGLTMPAAIAAAGQSGLFVLDDAALEGLPLSSARREYWLHRIVSGKLETLCENRLILVSRK